MAAVFQLVSQLSHSLMKQDTASALRYVWNILCVVCSIHTHTHIQNAHVHTHTVNRHSYSHLNLLLSTFTCTPTDILHILFLFLSQHTHSMTQIPILHVPHPPVRVGSTSCMPLPRMAPSPTTMTSLLAAGQ